MFKKRKITLSILIALIPLFFLVGIVYASFGVGISAPTFRLGKVKPNKFYDLGKIVVLNVGNEYGCYKMNVAYQHQQPEKKIPKEWVTFTPEEFCLNPYYDTHETKVVDVDLLIEPRLMIDKGLSGDYFAYLEACTYKGWIGACAATKLYFTIGN